jgi:hypothetical protein
LRKKLVQYVSIASLVLGGISAALELLPANYDREATPEKYMDWLKEQEEEVAGNTELLAQKLTNGRFKRAMERIKSNLAVNKKKSRWMAASFVFALISFGANLVTLSIRLFS